MRRVMCAFAIATTLTYFPATAFAHDRFAGAERVGESGPARASAEAVQPAQGAIVIREQSNVCVSVHVDQQIWPTPLTEDSARNFSGHLMAELRRLYAKVAARPSFRAGSKRRASSPTSTGPTGFVVSRKTSASQFDTGPGERAARLQPTIASSRARLFARVPFRET